MIMITLILLYVHEIIFHDDSNEDELDLMGLHYLIMFRGHWSIDLDNYSIRKHHMLDGVWFII